MKTKFYPELGSGTKKLIIILSLTLVILMPVFSIPLQSRAESVTLAMTVPSQVSLNYSYSTLEPKETLADPINHPSLLTVYLRDQNKNPLVDKNVEVSSSRGNIDVIEATSKLSSSEAGSLDISDYQKDRTDVNGQASFRIASSIPGEATLNITADNIVKLPSQNIKFLPLPFPADLTLSVDLPFTEKELIIISPPVKKSQESISPEGVKMQIPFWWLILPNFIIIICLIFIILNFLNLRKIRKFEEQEAKFLKKLVTAYNFINQEPKNK